MKNKFCLLISEKLLSMREFIRQLPDLRAIN